MADPLTIVLQFVVPGAVAAIIAGAFAVFSQRRKAVQDRVTETFPGWEELVAENRALRGEISAVRLEVDQLRAEVTDVRRTEARKMAAVARILRALQQQWPGAEMPRLDPGDISEIEDTIPPAWLRPRKDTP